MNCFQGLLSFPTCAATGRTTMMTPRTASPGCASRRDGASYKGLETVLKAPGFSIYLILQVSQSNPNYAWFQRLNLKHDKLPSSFAFNLNLRRYIKDDGSFSYSRATYTSKNGDKFTASFDNDDEVLIPIRKEYLSQGRAVQVETCVCKHGVRRRWRVCLITHV
jgi:hypothetical protein